MSVDHQKLNERLRTWIVDPADKDRKCKVIKLWQLLADESLGEVKAYKITKNMNIGDLAMQIESDAEADALGIGETTKYKVLAYFSSKDDSKTSSSPEGGRYTFYITPLRSEDPETSGTFSEGATPKGHMAQMMRHVEAMTKLSISSTTENQRNLVQLLNLVYSHLMRTHAALEKCQAEREEMIQGYEATLSEQAQRDLARAESYASMERGKQIIKMLAMVAPVLVNKLAGRKLLPEGMSAQIELLKQFATSLEDEQKLAIAMALKPEQLAAFGSIMENMSSMAEDESDAELTKEVKTMEKMGVGYEGGDPARFVDTKDKK